MEADSFAGSVLAALARQTPAFTGRHRARRSSLPDETNPADSAVSPTAADLPRSRPLTRSEVLQAYAEGVDLSETNLTGADLNDASLTDAWLQKADLSGADLTGASLAGARWTSETRWPERLREEIVATSRKLRSGVFIHEA